MLYSVIARYGRQTGSELPAGFAIRLFGMKSPPYAVNLSNIARIAQNLAGAWSPTADELVLKHTAFPFFAAFVDQATRDAKLHLLKASPRAMSPADISGARSETIPPVSRLRFCPECRTQDLDLYGETYWHLPHQLVGVPICAEHGTMLAQTAVSARMWGLKFTDADSATDLHEPSEPALGGEIANLIGKISDLCLGYLEQGRLGIIEPIDYKKAAVAAGYTRRILNVDIEGCGNAFDRFYGTELLKLLTGEQKRGPWFLRAFQGSALPPHVHAMLALFFARGSERIRARRQSNNMEHPTRDTVFWCPNPCVNHSEPTVEEVAFMKKQDGSRYCMARCSCGLRFSFDRLSPDGKPVIMRVLHFGPAWVAAGQDMLASGTKQAAIMEKMGLSRRQFRHLRSEIQGMGTRRAQVEEIKSAWLSLRSAGAQRLQHPLYKQYAAATQRIRLRDKVWLTETIRSDRNSQFDPSRSYARSEDHWSRKDAEALAKLEAAVRMLESDPGGLRRTRNGITTAAGVNVRDGRLVRSNAFVTRSIESKADYVRRRIIHAAASLSERGEPLSMKSLKLEAAIQPDVEFKAFAMEFLASRLCPPRS